MLRYITAGESHGKVVLALVEGFPAGVSVDVAAIDADLRRRQGGYGRSARQQIESDRVEILAGLWYGVTIGSPIALQVANRDARLDTLEDLDSPRPGHGDLSGAVKYLGSMRGVLERASARETAARVAAGALAKQLLRAFQIEVVGYVTELGGVAIEPKEGTPEEQRQWRDASLVYSLDPARDDEIRQVIDNADEAGDTLGGVVEVSVTGVPFGLGTHAQWNEKLDGRIAQGVMAVQAIKGVEIGLGFQAARLRGSQVHDAILYDEGQKETPTLGYVRPTNHAGGIEGGMTNGQPIIVRAAMKPISTLRNPLPSVDLATKQRSPVEAAYERSDICAVPATAIVVENVVAFEIARALVEKFGGDSLTEMQACWKVFHQLARKR